MHFGVQLCAPVGFGSFRKKVRYYFAGDAEDGSVHLVWFNREKGQWRVYLLSPPRTKFEEYLSATPPKLKVHDVQLELPPWLEQIQGLRVDALESERPGEPVEPYVAQVRKRLLALGGALEAEDEILSAVDPLKLLNRHAAAAPGSVHPHRFQLWFFAFVLHGREFWALRKSTEGTGKWSRSAKKHEDKKFGATSADESTPFNSPSGPAAKKMVDCYLKYCGLGITMAVIYEKSMRKDFGCVAVRNAANQLTFSHPKGEPVYSYGQFRYRVVKALGLPQIRQTLYGAPRVRKKKQVDVGNFTGQYGRILEAFEVDAYNVSDRPSAMFGDGPADRLAVARGVDCTTSSVTGVGFSIGAENAEAYRAMLFFGVAPTEYLEKIYGIPAGHLSDMHSLGLPSNFRSDRGPAGYRGLVDELEVKFPMKSVVPSYEPGSKALVESGHPRDVQLEGAPSYVQSELNIPQMIKREIYQMRLDNLSSDISARLTDEQIIEFEQKGLLANPHDYATYLIDKVATAGRKISLHKAVRAFWTPIKLTLSKDGVHYRHRYFRSDALDATGVQDRLGLTPSIEVGGYCLSAVFLSVWVEINGQLVEVEPVMRARQDREDLLTSKSDVEATAVMLKRIKSKSRASALAARSDCKAKFKEATNQEWDVGRRVGGIPKKAKGTVAHEMMVAKGKSKAGKVA